MNSNSINKNLPIIFENQKLRALGFKRNNYFNTQLKKNVLNNYINLKKYTNKGIQNNLINNNFSSQISSSKRNINANDSDSTVDISSFYTFKTKRNIRKINYNQIKSLSQDRKEKEMKKNEDKIFSTKHLILPRQKSQIYFSVFKDLEKDNVKKIKYVNNKFNIRYAENENYYKRIINKVNKMRNESYFIINHDLDKDKLTEKRHERLKETKNKLKFIKNVLDYAFDSLLQKKLNEKKRNNSNEIKRNNSCEYFN